MKFQNVQFTALLLHTEWSHRPLKKNLLIKNNSNLNVYSASSQEHVMKLHKPRLSISFMHNSTTAGIKVFWALTKVVRSIPNIRLMYFMSGRQSFGTFSEQRLCAFKPQSASTSKTTSLQQYCVINFSVQIWPTSAQLTH